MEIPHQVMIEPRKATNRRIRKIPHQVLIEPRKSTNIRIRKVIEGLEKLNQKGEIP